MIKYTIYSLIDPITDEIRYIGLTFNSLKQRLKSHLSEKSGTHKSNWIQKLKSEGMRPIIESIEDNISTYEDCCEKEEYYINKYRLDGHNLTNMASGGNKNKKMSKETREKMSQSAKNRNFKLVLTDEIKRQISISTKKRFENIEERIKLSKSNKRYEDSKTEEEKLNDILIQKSKTVIQYDMDMNFIREFPSIRNAEKVTGLANSNISKCCNHKIVFVGGFVWRFVGDLTPPVYKNRRVVHQFDMDMNLIFEYDNINRAFLITGINESSIRNCCKGKYKSAGGFIWKYK